MATFAWHNVAVPYGYDDAEEPEKGSHTFPLDLTVRPGTVTVLLSPYPRQLAAVSEHILQPKRAAGADRRPIAAATGHLSHLASEQGLCDTSTVGENVRFAASLRLAGESSGKRAEAVARVIEAAALQDVVGLSLARACTPDSSDPVSFYRRHLVSFAIELLHRPSLLVVDDVGSVDDENYTWRAMQPFYSLVANLARTMGMAVVLSVGRNRYDLRSVAEQTIVLAPTFVIYAGPTKGLCGHLCAVFKCSREDEASSRLSALLWRRPAGEAECFANGALFLQLRRAAPSPPTGSGSDNPAGTPPLPVMLCPPPPPPCGRSFVILYGALVREELGNKWHLLIGTSSAVVSHLLIGFVFFQLSISPSDLSDIQGYLFFVSVYYMLSFSLPAVVGLYLALHRFQSLMARRRRIVRLAPFLLAQFCALLLPIKLPVYVVSSIGMYYISGMIASPFYHIIVFEATLILLAACSAAMGLMAALIAGSIERAQIVVPFVGIIAFVMGNLTTVPNATWILRWIQYLSPVFWAYQCLIRNELGGVASANILEVYIMPTAASLGALALLTVLFLAVAVIVLALHHH